MFTGNPPTALGARYEPWGAHLTVIPNGPGPMLLLEPGVSWGQVSPVPSWVIILMIILKSLTMLLLPM